MFWIDLKSANVNIVLEIHAPYRTDYYILYCSLVIVQDVWVKSLNI